LYLAGTNCGDDVAKNNWKINLKDILIPVLSTLVALAGIASGFLMQRSTMQSQIEMKKYEITYTSNQKSYADFMQNFENAFTYAFQCLGTGKNGPQITASLDQMQYSYRMMEPFLNKSTKELMPDKIVKYSIFCYMLCLNTEITETKSVQIATDKISYENFFRDTLCQQLFDIAPSLK
jgi:uncharacterized membrane-anchored protein YhcB (DUF1043 family)